jgi:hypothetical protein
MPSLGQMLPDVLPKRERQTVVLVRHPDHPGGPAHSTSVSSISDSALSCWVVEHFFMRGGALAATETN